MFILNVWCVYVVLFLCWLVILVLNIWIRARSVGRARIGFCFNVYLSSICWYSLSSFRVVLFWARSVGRARFKWFFLFVFFNIFLYFLFGFIWLFFEGRVMVFGFMCLFVGLFKVMWRGLCVLVICCLSCILYDFGFLCSLVDLRGYVRLFFVLFGFLGLYVFVLFCMLILWGC